MAVYTEACVESQFSGVYSLQRMRFIMYMWFKGLSMLYLIVGINKEIYGFLKNASRTQPFKNIFLQNTTIQSIGTMLLAP